VTTPFASPPSMSRPRVRPGPAGRRFFSNQDPALQHCRPALAHGDLSSYEYASYRALAPHATASALFGGGARANELSVAWPEIDIRSPAWGIFEPAERSFVACANRKSPAEQRQSSARPVSHACPFTSLHDSCRRMHRRRPVAFAASSRLLVTRAFATERRSKTSA